MQPIFIHAAFCFIGEKSQICSCTQTSSGLRFAALLSRDRNRPSTMKDDERSHSNKHLNVLGLPPSTAGGTSSAIVSFTVIAVVVLNCWWFLLLPRQSDLAIPDFYTRNNSSIHRTLNHTENSLAPSGICNLSQGQWVPDTSPPLYTNDTCRYIQPSQNCLRNGRPDRGYLNWRWKPLDCELPPFDAALFLDLMRGKKFAFIGDSLARNHMQALQCALAQVEDPINLFSDPRDKEYRWLFASYNFTLTNLWSPFLVNYTVEHEVYKLYLDVPETVWSSQLAEYDIAIVSTGYWYFRKGLYYVNNKIVGASLGSGLNANTVELLSAMRTVLRNVLKHVSTEYRGFTILRTITVDHFEHGAWSNGGMCNRTHPSFEDTDAPPLPWMNKEINKVQVEEFTKAKAFVNNTSKLKLLDVTESAYLRPDGHPGPYRIRQANEPPNDCLHWCLPGPIDMWNQLVLQALKS